jgi:hypothetical protein
MLGLPMTVEERRIVEWVADLVGREWTLACPLNAMDRTRLV